MKNSVFMLTMATLITSSCSINFISQSDSSTKNYSDMMICPFDSNYVLGKEDTQTNYLINTIVVNGNADYSSKYKKYKALLYDFEDNEEELVQMLKEDEQSAEYFDFVKYLFEKDDKIVCERFISTILCEDISIFNRTYKNGLEICLKSKYKSLSKKAKNILEYYAEEFAVVN